MAQSRGIPSSVERNTSVGISRIVLVIGATVTFPMYFNTEVPSQNKNRPFFIRTSKLIPANFTVLHTPPQAGSVSQIENSSMWITIAIMIHIIVNVKIVLSGGGDGVTHLLSYYGKAADNALYAAILKWVTPFT
jgi:hypothetical protein